MRVWWYLSSQFLKSVFSVLFFALSIYFILTYMEETQHYFNGFKINSKVIFFYYLWQIPSIFIMLLPFAVLVGGILFHWVLAKNGEISAFRAAGASVFKIALPIFCLGAGFSLLQFLINEFVIPYTATQFQYVKNIQIEGQKNTNPFVTSTWLKAPATVLHFEKYEPLNQTLTKPEFFVFGQDDNSLKTIVRGQSAHFDPEKQRWILNVTSGDDFQSLPGKIQSFQENTYETNVNFAPPQVLKPRTESSQLSYWQLKRLIKEAQKAGSNASDRIIDLHLKISLPFANFLFIFLTLPFALRKERQEEHYFGIVVCLAAALAYWFGNLSLKNLAATGHMNPIIAAWFMNSLIACLGFFLIRKLDKGQ